MVRQKVLYARLQKAAERAQQLSLEEEDNTIQNQHALDADNEGTWSSMCDTGTLSLGKVLYTAILKPHFQKRFRSTISMQLINVSYEQLQIYL